MVRLIAGDGSRRLEIPTQVVTLTQEQMELLLTVAPFETNTLAPGSQVRIVHAGGKITHARVLWLETIPEPVLMVEPLDSESDEDNRRKARRIPMQLIDAHALFVTPKGAISFRVRVVDLSAGGARLLSPRRLTSGAKLDLRMPLSLVKSSEPLYVRSRIVWVRQLYQSCLVGIQFHDVTEAERNVLLRAVFLGRWNKDV